MICVGSGLRIEAPLDEPAPTAAQGRAGGEQVAVGIRASDIILAHHEPAGTSARNRLRGVVTSVETSAPGYEVTLDCGQPLRCRITGASLEEMAIEPGSTLWAVFKASSCFIVQDPAP